MIENKINRKRYIGQTIQHWSRRISKTLKSHTRDNKKLKCDVLKYGVHNFTVTIISYYDNSQLDLYEKWFIMLYNTIECGYNSDIGGRRGKHNYGKKCPRCGKLFRGKNKYCCKADKRLIDKICICCGKNYKVYPSKYETSKYCSNKCKNAHNKILMIGNKRSKNKLNGSKNGRAKKVKCLETNIIYECAKDASMAMGCKSNVVAQCCNGKQKTVKGFHFCWC